LGILDTYDSIDEPIGDDVRGGDEPKDENDWSFMRNLTLPLPLATATDPFVLTSSGMFAQLFSP
jgi:hypothetical protein